MDVIAIVKEHPVPIGIGVFLVVLVMMSRGSSSSGAGNGAAIAASAQASANQANVQMAGLSSNSAIALGAQSVQSSSNSENAATSRMGIAASLLQSFAGLGATEAMNSNNNNLKGIQSLYSKQIAQQQLSDDLAVKSATISANMQMNVDTLNANIRALDSNNNAKLAQIGALTQGNIAAIGAQSQATVAAIGQSGQVQAGLLAQNLGYSDKNLSTILQHAENMANIDGATKLAIVQTQQQAANTAAQANKNSSDWGVVKDIGGAIAAFMMA